MMAEAWFDIDWYAEQALMISGICRKWATDNTSSIFSRFKLSLEVYIKSRTWPKPGEEKKKKHMSWLGPNNISCFLVSRIVRQLPHVSCSLPAALLMSKCTTSFWSRKRVRKYTLQAASTALWALKSTPSTTKVQSHSRPCLRCRLSCSRTSPLCQGNSITARVLKHTHKQNKLDILLLLLAEIILDNATIDHTAYVCMNRSIRSTRLPPSTVSADPLTHDVSSMQALHWCQHHY